MSLKTFYGRADSEITRVARYTCGFHLRVQWGDFDLPWPLVVGTGWRRLEGRFDTHWIATGRRR